MKGNGSSDPLAYPGWYPPSPPAYTVYMSQGLPGKVVMALREHTEAHPVAILLQYLTEVGNAIGRSPCYQVEGDQHRANLFCLIAGLTSSARKGTAASRVRQIMEAAEPKWARARVLKGMSSGEGIIHAVRDAVWEKAKPRKRKGFADDGEDVLVDEGVLDKRLMLIEAEFERALAVMHREGNILSTVLRDAWDGLDLATLTKHSPTRATGAHISIIGHITIEELRQSLDKTSMCNGYANRFLFAFVERARILPFGGEDLDPAVIAELGRQTHEAIKRAQFVGRIQWAEEAREHWKSIYPNLSNEERGLSGALVARAAPQVVRLAMIHALLDHTDEIGLKHLNVAENIWNYCRKSVQYIFGDLLGNPIADDILRALRHSPNGMTRTEIAALFGRNQGADRIGNALRILLEHGKARGTTQQTRGRPSEVWTAIS
jgi:hypothetical protein